MSLTVEDSEFYMVQLPNHETIHQTEKEAISHLRENAPEIDPESDEVSIIRVNVEGSDWTIAEMSWQNIALQLMGE